jgi:hypothetical protein
MIKYIIIFSYILYYITMTNDHLFTDIYTRFRIKINNDIHNMNDAFRDFEIIEDTEMEVFEIINSIDESKLVMDNIKKKLNTESRYILFLKSLYMDRIFDSYGNNEEEIFRQFQIDVPRMKIYYDGLMISDPLKLEEKLDIYSHNFMEINSKNYTLKVILMALCNQSSFAFPYMIVRNLYEDSTKMNYVFSHKTKMHIDNKKDIPIHLQATFKIKNIYTGDTISKIKIITKLDLYNKYGVMIL